MEWWWWWWWWVHWLHHWFHNHTDENFVAPLPSTSGMPLPPTTCIPFALCHVTFSTHLPRIQKLERWSTSTKTSGLMTRGFTTLCITHKSFDLYSIGAQLLFILSSYFLSDREDTRGGETGNMWQASWAGFEPASAAGSALAEPTLWIIYISFIHGLV